LLHVLIIALFMVVVLHDGWRSGLSPSSAASRAGSLEIWVSALGPMLVLALATWATIGALARDVQRRGSWRSARMAERTLGLSRWAAVLLHAANVLSIGLLDEVRMRIGDLIALDELAVISLPIGIFLVGWWAYEPIERTLRDATTLRMLDSGRPVFAAPTRAQYVLLQLRHQVLLSLVPIGMIAVWSEAMQRGLRWLASHASRPGNPHHGLLARIGDHLSTESAMAWANTALQLLGVAIVFAISPLLLRRVWDTVRIAPGPLRSRLAAICSRSGVRIRDLLVWRTHGTMINGAVIGLIAPLRYILLTDALLEHLSSRQVEAVMAHEVGHARHKHMPWLTLSMLVGITGAATMLSLLAWGAIYLLDALGHSRAAHAVDQSSLAEGGIVVGSFILGLSWFGFISRRFEWQADAFAAQQLSLTPAASPYYEESVEPTLWGFSSHPSERSPVTPPATRITTEAVASMTGALEAVAELNHMSRGRKSWRHGSIAYRQHRLRSLIGHPLDRLRIDRVVRRLKAALALALAAIIALAVWSQFA